MPDVMDVVDPADRRLHELLVRIAESSDDEDVRRRALDLTLRLPPVRTWPVDALRRVHDTVSALTRAHPPR